MRPGPCVTDPIGQFQALFAAALEKEPADATAAALATADATGAPSVRMVLLKGVDTSGFVFFTNYGSRKARDLAVNPRAALCFYWPTLGVQVRVEGAVERAPRKNRTPTSRRARARASSAPGRPRRAHPSSRPRSCVRASTASPRGSRARPSCGPSSGEGTGSGPRASRCGRPANSAFTTASSTRGRATAGRPSGSTPDRAAVLRHSYFHKTPDCQFSSTWIGKALSSSGRRRTRSDDPAQWLGT